MDPDPDQNFHFYADPDPDPDRHQKDADPHADRATSFTHVGKSEILFYFLSQHCQFAVHYLSHHCQRCHNFQYFAHLEMFWKKSIVINSLIC